MCLTFTENKILINQNFIRIIFEFAFYYYYYYLKLLTYFIENLYQITISKLLKKRYLSIKGLTKKARSSKTRMKILTVNFITD